MARTLPRESNGTHVLANFKRIGVKKSKSPQGPKAGPPKRGGNSLYVAQYARIVQKLSFPAKFKECKIQNTVGSCDVKFPIRLEALAYSHSAFSSVSDNLKNCISLSL
ncbi:unnamed protein product [Eruca vesicaria subsp. sativa]|uniref:Uncharacterized protein n=1 Tax=Eruca vesicaria subsp. sativa TaxID=29727 RepID=A0ABC8J6P3_ERUVS|nr:unnamed protein product [Eruca vesicaria subsp. sativa]